MKGASRYAKLFKTGQYDRLYIVSGRHARGATFSIYILPFGVDGISNGENNAPLNIDAVEVYGVLGGQRGWTEYYGWKHEGLWVADFLIMVEGRLLAIQESNDEHEKNTLIKTKKSRVKTKALLDAY